MGQAIPNAEILVVREDGSPCAPGEPGRVVHRGALVSLGYWNDRERTNERFKPAPGQPAGIPNPELAVWSGDQVRRDAQGFLYFISRKDEQIKTSGYRVSPTEVEEVVYGSGLVAEAAAIGVPHETLGQSIMVIAKAAQEHPDLELQIIEHCRGALPGFMVPSGCSSRTACRAIPTARSTANSSPRAFKTSPQGSQANGRPAHPRRQRHLSL